MSRFRSAKTIVNKKLLAMMALITLSAAMLVVTLPTTSFALSGG